MNDKLLINNNCLIKKFLYFKQLNLFDLSLKSCLDLKKKF